MMKQLRIIRNVGLFWIFSFCLTFAQSSEKVDQWAIPPKKENFHIFILMGQSNMSGCGDLLPEDSEPAPFVLMVPREGEVAWEPARHPLHPKARFGLGLPFALNYLKNRPGVVVGLIAGAKAKNIDRQSKNRSNIGIYANAIERAKFAMSQGVIKGVLWQHGEADSLTPARAGAYEKKLHKVIQDVRKDLKNDQLPFIVGDLGQFYGSKSVNPKIDLEVHRKGIDQIRKAFRALPEKVPYTAFVDSLGVKDRGDSVHFSREALITLGERYAEAYNSLIKEE